MQPQEPVQQPDTQQDVDNRLLVLQEGERILCTIKRHPIGLFAVYVANTIVVVGFAILMFGILPTVLPSSVDQSAARQLGLVSVVLVAILCSLITLIASKVYWGNMWILTDDSMTQINQVSLFNRQSSQLALTHIEDVTAEQGNIVQQFLGYGTLRVETAGEHSKFQFAYCPNPNMYAREILAARETLMHKQPDHA